MSNGDIIKEGYLRRLKTQKKRYFVLRSSVQTGQTRLEYYENEKKFRSKGPPRRVIYLASCLNIARKGDTRQKSVFALYTREDVFGLVAESETELNLWLTCLKTSQNKTDSIKQPVSTWHVTVKPRGLGTSKALAGQYDLQLSSRNLALMKTDSRETIVNFNFVNIRRCGHTDCFFFMELGRSAVTGAGEVWMQVDDQIIAQNMHKAIIGTMQNISAADSNVQVRRRCESEGKRGKAKTRPLSAVVLSGSRGRSDTDPASPDSRTRTSSSGSVKALSPDSPRTKRVGMLSRILPKKKSKDVSKDYLPGNTNSNTEVPSTNDYTKSKVVILAQDQPSPTDEVKPHPDTDPASPDSRTRTSSSGSVKALSPDSPRTKRVGMLSRILPKKKSKDEYVNIGPGCTEVAPDQEDYLKMNEYTGSGRRSSDSYMDMVRKSWGTPKLALCPPEGSYINMSLQGLDKEQGDNSLTSREPVIIRTPSPKQQSPTARSDFVLQKRSSSPRQLKTNESALPNKLDIREFVNFKKSPVSSRRRSSQDYVPMNPVSVWESDVHSYMNFSPIGANSKTASAENDSSESHCYVNFSPGNDFVDSAKHITERSEGQTPPKLLQNQAASESRREMHSYVNFSPGDAVDEKAATSNFRKHSLESILTEKPREYLNVNVSGIPKSKSAIDVPEYVNFSPGKPLEDHSETALANGTMENDNDVREYINFSPGKFPEEAWRKSPRSNRRESEPARLQPLKYFGNSLLDSTNEDEEQQELNYIMVDLTQSDSPSRRRRRPPNIDLSSCHRSATGPKSAPVTSPYAEIDFTKSHGIRQARLEIREAKS